MTNKKFAKIIKKIEKWKKTYVPPEALQFTTIGVSK